MIWVNMLAKVGFIILCDEVFNNQGNITIDKPLTHIAPYTIPGQFSFTLSFSVFNIEPRKENILRVRLISPTNKIELNMNFDFKYDDGSTDVVQSTVLNIPFRNFLFTESGLFKFEIDINNSEDVKYLDVPIVEAKVKGNE